MSLRHSWTPRSSSEFLPSWKGCRLSRPLYFSFSDLFATFSFTASLEYLSDWIINWILARLRKRMVVEHYWKDLYCTRFIRAIPQSRALVVADHKIRAGMSWRARREGTISRFQQSVDPTTVRGFDNSRIQWSEDSSKWCSFERSKDRWAFLISTLIHVYDMLFLLFNDFSVAPRGASSSQKKKRHLYAPLRIYLLTSLVLFAVV